jgi:pyruvate carboxylase
MGIIALAIYSKEDALSLHKAVADEAYLLPGSGTSAYLDMAAVIEAAKASGASAVHPGYGFLSENADFVRRCEKARLIFVGPSSAVIELFGDKTKARQLAVQMHVPVNKGSNNCSNIGELQAVMEAKQMQLPVMLKAANGGGGRGMRKVFKMSALEGSFNRCVSEAEGAFGNGAVFVEALIQDAYHIEVQILADRSGHCIHLFERNCSIQVNHQKMVEVAPARGIHPSLRTKLTDCALAIAREAGYTNAGTVEFLVKDALWQTRSRISLLSR